MKNLLLACFLAVFAFACSEKRTVEKNVEITRNEDGNTTTEKTTASGTDTAGISKAETSKIGLVIKKTHIFSDPTKADNFQLQVTGPSLLNSTVWFTITDPEGRILYKDSLSGQDLEASMVYEMKTPAASQQEREAFVKKRLNQFFDNENFSTPAIAPNDAFNTAFGEQTHWEAIKADKNAVGFNYLVGKENGRRIAYSKLRKKVMLVGNYGG